MYFRQRTFIKISITFLLLVVGLHSSPNRYISGTVLDTRSNPLYGANVVLQNTYQGSTTDSLGFYKIEGLDVGKYTIMVSYIGYRSQKIDIYISEFDAKDKSASGRSIFLKTSNL